MRARQCWLVGFGLAVAVAVTLNVGRPSPSWHPLCVLYEPGSLEWLLFGCWIDPPPKDPQA